MFMNNVNGSLDTLKQEITEFLKDKEQRLIDHFQHYYDNLPDDSDDLPLLSISTCKYSNYWVNTDDYLISPPDHYDDEGNKLHWDPHFFEVHGRINTNDLTVEFISWIVSLPVQSLNIDLMYDKNDTKEHINQLLTILCNALIGNRHLICLKLESNVSIKDINLDLLKDCLPFTNIRICYIYKHRNFQKPISDEEKTIEDDFEHWANTHEKFRSKTKSAMKR